MIKKNVKGQGIVEYAGALVVAALIISAAVAFAPQAVGTLFTNIVNNISTFLMAELPTATP